MKLQSNHNGAWRDVIEFRPERLSDVQGAAYGLALSAARPRFRIERGAGREPVYLEASTGNWRELKNLREPC